MADDPTPTSDPTPPPKPEPAPAPAPEPAPAIDEIELKKNVAYFARNPDAFEAVISELEKAGQVQIRAEVSNLKRELTVRDAITEYGLTRADADFIRGNTPEEINASAKALKDRIGDPKPTENGEKTGEPAPKEPEPAKPPEVPPLPEHRGGVSAIKQAEADLIESSREFCENFDPYNL